MILTDDQPSSFRVVRLQCKKKKNLNREDEV